MLTSAGYWNAIVSQPLFKFVILSWVADYLFWIYFLWKTSRLPLRVVATHPDGVGGLSFVRVAQTQFCVAAFAFSCTLCSMIGQSVHYMHISTPILLKTKLHGVFTYGQLCTELCHDFAGKWLPADEAKEKALLECADSSALCDMNGVYQSIQNMKPMLFDRQFIITFIVAACLPAIPLVTLIMPLKEILMRILKALT